MQKLKQKLRDIKKKILIFINKTIKKAQRIALAVVIVQFMLVIGFNQLAKTDIIPKLTKNEVITIQNVQAQEPKEEQKPEIKETTEAERIADIIYTLESSRGINNYSKCEAQGLYNGYGFAIPGNGNYKCFKEGEDREAVIEWINDKIAKNFTESEIYCYYNLGIKSNTCPYYQKAQSIQ